MGYFQNNVYDVDLWHVTIAKVDFDGAYTAVQKFRVFKMFLKMFLMHPCWIYFSKKFILVKKK